MLDSSISTTIQLLSGIDSIDKVLIRYDINPCIAFIMPFTNIDENRKKILKKVLE